MSATLSNRTRAMTRRRRRRNSSTTKTTFLLLFFFFFCLTVVVEAQFGRKKRLEAAAAAAEAERLSNLVVIGGIEINKTVFYIITGLIGALLAAFLLFDISVEQVLQQLQQVPTSILELFDGFGGSFASKKRRRRKRPGGNRADDDDTMIDVIVIGIGLPKKGMGWYHLTQLLEMKTINVRAIVEPFFLNPELCPEPPQSFAELVTELKEMGVICAPSIAELVGEEDDDFRGEYHDAHKTLCLIAARTADNPKLFEECIHYSLAKVLYLEKPGAPSVQELESMKALALQTNTQVYLGYNKNVTPYIQKTIALAKTVKHAHVFLCHNNSYTQADLPEVFFRNSEGMLKNMAVHELAILVTFFDVTVSQISKFKINTSKLFSEKLSIWKPGTSLPNPEYVTDFSRVAFKITTKSGTNVSVMADRCGGNVSFAVVKDEHGKEVQKFEFPDPKTAALIEEQVAEDPAMMPYFFVQSNDYQELKHRVVNSMIVNNNKNKKDDVEKTKKQKKKKKQKKGNEEDANGGDDDEKKTKTTTMATTAQGVATIQVGIEALKLAEYATEQLNKTLSSSKSK
mmetsp:Transcript_17491/g.25899  ORF Transcript_17491/g.25899 Transcript_17491/m.25899 type:complete len:570 (-) Transcript_17491:383-2092(-)